MTEQPTRDKIEAALNRWDRANEGLPGSSFVNVLVEAARQYLASLDAAAPSALPGTREPQHAAPKLMALSHDCSHGEISFGSGDYYVFCAHCGARWGRLGDQPEYGINAKGEEIGCDPSFADGGARAPLSRPSPPVPQEGVSEERMKCAVASGGRAALAVLAPLLEDNARLKARLESERSQHDKTVSELIVAEARVKGAYTGEHALRARVKELEAHTRALEANVLERDKWCDGWKERVRELEGAFAGAQAEKVK